MLKEFREFILRGNLVDLAVAVVSRRHSRCWSPRWSRTCSRPRSRRSAASRTSRRSGSRSTGSEFRYGDFINALIAFLIIATVLFFFVIKPVNALLSRLRTEPPVAQETHPCPECMSEIPVAARRRAFCTTQVAAAR